MIPHPHRWPSVALRRIDRLPESPGLYAVCSLGRILYIGRSSNIYRRWNATGDRRHHRYWLASIQPWCRVRYHKTPMHKMVEGQAIRQHQPAWNWRTKPWWWNSDQAWLGKAGAIGWVLWGRRSRPGGNNLLLIAIVAALQWVVLGVMAFDVIRLFFGS